MKERKPRHNPNKPQNKYGSICKCYLSDGGYYCPAPHMTMDQIEKICHFNPHNCSKVKYRLLASITDNERNRLESHSHIGCYNYSLTT